MTAEASYWPSGMSLAALRRVRDRGAVGVIAPASWSHVQRSARANKWFEGAFQWACSKALKKSGHVVGGSYLPHL